MKDEIVVTSLSGQRVEWGHLSRREADLNLGSMGNALAVGIGLALALPRRKVLVFESDGSLRGAEANSKSRKRPTTTTRKITAAICWYRARPWRAWWRARA